MLMQRWNQLSQSAIGRSLFNAFLRIYIPYTGTVSPQVLEIKTGTSRVQLRDRRRVRNHLNSIHAVALMNVGELSTGLAITAKYPGKIRIILVGFEIEYLKKARGTVVAEAVCPDFDFQREQNVAVVSEIRNAGGEIVARAKSSWRVRPSLTEK